MTAVLVDLDAYRRNLDLLAARLAPAELMAVVKADAYGHGLLPICRAAVAAGIRTLGVLDPASALLVRRGGIGAGIGDGIRLFAWLFAADEDYRPSIEAEVDLGISSADQLERIASAGASRPALLHLKIDTGLHRNGASEEDWPGLVRRALQLQEAGVVELGGAWTHIGEASDEEDSAAIARFHAAIAVAEGIGARFRTRHLAASAAGFARTDARFDLVRVGAFTYGIAPGDGVAPADLGLVPVMTVRADVQELREVDGRPVAIVPLGFTDGIPSVAAGIGQVAIGGTLRLILGVGARHLEVDAAAGPPDRPEVRSGDACTILGTGAAGEWTLQDWADALGTIGEELVVRMAPRVPRTYLGT